MLHVFVSALNTCSGSLAGIGATCVCHPFDVLRTRLVGQGEPKVCAYMHVALLHRTTQLICVQQATFIHIYCNMSVICVCEMHASCNMHVNSEGYIRGHA